jgi:antitoxin ParD1/3/4
MARTMTVDLGNELRNYVESLVSAGDYRSNSEVLRESLRLLREKQAESKLNQLRHLIDEGEVNTLSMLVIHNEIIMTVTG